MALLFFVFSLRMNLCHTPSMVPYVVTCSMSGRIGMCGRHVAWSGLRGYNVFGDMDPHDSPPFPLYWGLSWPWPFSASRTSSRFHQPRVYDCPVRVLRIVANLGPLLITSPTIPYSSQRALVIRTRFPIRRVLLPWVLLLLLPSLFTALSCAPRILLSIRSSRLLAVSRRLCMVSISWIDSSLSIRSCSSYLTNSSRFSADMLRPAVIRVREFVVTFT